MYTYVLYIFAGTHMKQYDEYEDWDNIFRITKPPKT